MYWYCLLRITYQTQLDLQHGGGYLVTTDTEFGGITAPYL